MYIVILWCAFAWNSNPNNLWHFQPAAELEEISHKGSQAIEDVFDSSSNHYLSWT